MNAAFAVWEGRVAPVFDVARQIRLLRIDAGREVCGADESLEGLLPAEKVLRLAELDVGVLVCGAISRPIQRMVEAYGIRVIPFVAGELTCVVQAWMEDRLSGRAHAMPGCGGRWRRRGGRGRGMDRE